MMFVFLVLMSCSSPCERLCGCVVKAELKGTNKGTGLPQQIAESNNKKKQCIATCERSPQTACGKQKQCCSK